MVMHVERNPMNETSRACSSHSLHDQENGGAWMTLGVGFFFIFTLTVPLVIPSITRYTLLSNRLLSITLLVSGDAPVAWQKVRNLTVRY